MVGIFGMARLAVVIDRATDCMCVTAWIGTEMVFQCYLLHVSKVWNSCVGRIELRLGFA